MDSTLALQIIVIFIIALVISTLGMPLLSRLSIRIGWVAQIRNDRWSSRPVPTLGGVGIFIAFLMALTVGVIYQPEILESVWPLVICCGLMFLLGLYDDIKKIKPPTKLIWQMLGATLLIFIGEMRIDFFPWPIANIILTYLWLVGITNAVNLLDNMDGLAGGITVIAGIILAIYYLLGGQNHILILIASLVGATLGFLFFNFPPAKIFMANSGSMFLGFLLAALPLGRQSQASNVFAALGVPTLIMLLPILDTSFVMITRLLRGQSPIRGGTDHTSHRLIAFGLSERQTVLVLYGVAVISGISAAGLETMDYDLSLVVIPFVLIMLALFTAYLGKVRVITGEGHEYVKRLVGVLTYQRRLFEIILDLIIIGFSYYLAYWTRYGLDMTPVSIDLFMNSWPIALGSAYIWFYVFGIYRGVWGFLGAGDLLRYGWAAVCAGCTAWLGSNIIYIDTSYTPDIFIVYGLFLLIGLAGSRSSFQIIDRFSQRQKSRYAKFGVLIYGADDAGELVLSWILRNPQLGLKPFAFIDSKPQTWGKSIHGIRVIGKQEHWLRIIEGGQIHGIIIASHAQLDSPFVGQLLEKCKEKNLWVRKLQVDLIDVYCNK